MQSQAGLGEWKGAADLVRHHRMGYENAIVMRHR